MLFYWDASDYGARVFSDKQINQFSEWNFILILQEFWSILGYFLLVLDYFFGEILCIVILKEFE